jgi:hypothetical protein
MALELNNIDSIEGLQNYVEDCINDFEIGISTKEETISYFKDYTFFLLQKSSVKKVFEFLYNPCVEESAAKTVSIHLSKKGAQKAIKDHKCRLKEFYEACDFEDEFSSSWDDNQWWGVRETELLK